MKGSVGLLGPNEMTRSAELAKAAEPNSVPLVAGKGIFFCILLGRVAGDAKKNEAG